MNLYKWPKEEENLWPWIRHYIPETTLTDYKYKEKREEEHWKQRRRIDTRLEDFIQNHDGGLITPIRSDTDNTVDNRMTITRKQKWEVKQLYGRFKRLINNISHDKTWTWLLYIDLRLRQTCHSKDGGSAYSIGVGELGWQYGTGLKSHGTATNWCTGREWPVNCMTVISTQWW